MVFGMIVIFKSDKDHVLIYIVSRGIKMTCKFFDG